MEGLKFSRDKKRKKLSHYKILYTNEKGAFNDSNHIDTIKPGTLLGVTFKDREGNIIFSSQESKESQENKNPELEEDTLSR